MTSLALTAEREFARDFYPSVDWEQATINTGGQFHRVLIAEGQAVIRMARTKQASDDMPRSVQLHARTNELLDYQVPRPLSGVGRFQDLNAVVMSYVPGTAHPPHQGDPHVLRRVVTELARIPLGELEGLLAEPFAFRGPWTETRIAETYNGLPVELRAPAQALWAQLPMLAQVPAGLVHGDLAGHNMHWVDGELVGLLDWDLAAGWDPALNSAYLGLWHGRELIEKIAPDPATAHRAKIWLGLMALERVSDTLSRDDNPRMDKLLAKVAPRVMDAAAAL
ncbi:hypothetical protein GCM10027417_17110 [Glutamicibacter endophyticus]